VDTTIRVARYYSITGRLATSTMRFSASFVLKGSIIQTSTPSSFETLGRTNSGKLRKDQLKFPLGATPWVASPLAHPVWEVSSTSHVCSLLVEVTEPGVDPLSSVALSTFSQDVRPLTGGGDSPPRKRELRITGILGSSRSRTTREQLTRVSAKLGRMGDVTSPTTMLHSRLWREPLCEG
jgi:hypothetical protein